MAEKEYKMDSKHQHYRSSSRLVTSLSILSFLIASSCLAFLIYLHTLESQNIINQDRIIEKISEQAQKLNNDVDEAKNLVQNILKQLPDGNVLDRQKRDEFTDNEQAEEDLSELSLTALSFLRGPPGFPGRDGRDGAQGARGVAGVKGDPGALGPVGLKGAQGLTGSPGLNGRDGLQGPVGPRGNPGERGPSGNVGAPGAQGLPGARGEQGQRGVKGERGERGLPGEAGNDGAPGTGLESAEDTTLCNITSNQLAMDVTKLKETVQRLETLGGAVAEATRTLKCPGWAEGGNMSHTMIGDTCYVLVNQASSWTQARDFCQGRSYNLVSFDTGTENGLVENWLVNTLRRSSSQDYWTAGHRASGASITAWTWRHNDQEIPFGDYTNWQSSEPDSYDYCMSAKYTRWNGRSCSYRYTFVCEGTPAIETTDPQKSGGTVYTHWGRSTCGNTSLTLYSGVVGGAKYDSVGGGVNFQCLPPNPDLNDYNSHAVHVSWMRSVEYESQTYGLFGDQIDNTHAVCSKCYTRTRPALLMIPGKTTCPENWVTEYSGFLMAGKEDEAHPTTYECVDRAPQFQSLSPADLGGRFWFVNVDCQTGGSIGQCNLYRHGRQMSCVVCTK